MPRARGRGAHASINMSPMEMLEGELVEMEGFLARLSNACLQLGSAGDSAGLRQSIMDLKMNLANAEQAIGTRLKMEVSADDFDKQADLEDKFFELKANYFSVLRQCTSLEAQIPPPATVPGYAQDPYAGQSVPAPQMNGGYQQPPNPSEPIQPYTGYAQQTGYEPAPQQSVNQQDAIYQQEPVYEQQQPVYQQQQPPYQQEPAYQSQQPIYQEPVYEQQQQPAYQQPVYNEPAQQPAYQGGPNIQRFGNPHTSPALQNMNNGGTAPPPVSRAAKPLPTPDPFSRVESKSLPPPPGGNGYAYEQQSDAAAYGSAPVVPPVRRDSKPIPPIPQQSQPAQEAYAPQYDSNGVALYQEQQMLPPQDGGMQAQAQVQGQQDLEIDGVKLTYRDSVYWDTKEVVERNEEMQEISKEMVALTEVFQDVAVETDVQMEQVEQAEQQVETAQENTKQAVKTMGKTAKTAKKVLLPGVGGGAGAVSGAVVGGIIGSAAGGLVIPGAVIGAGVGAATGGLVGHGFGMVLRMHTDKDMHKARLSEQWAPDKSTKFCTGCGKKFTTTKRRHHCRNCGGLFCAKCTKHRMNIPGVDAENRPRVCNPCFEALMYHQQGVRPPPSWASTMGIGQDGQSNMLPAPEATAPMGLPPPLPSASSKPLPLPPGQAGY